MITILMAYAITVVFSVIMVAMHIGTSDILIKDVLKVFPFFIWQQIVGKNDVAVWMILATPTIFGAEVLMALFLFIGYYPIKALRWLLTLKVINR